MDSQWRRGSIRITRDVTQIARVLLMDLPQLLRQILEHAISQHRDLQLTEAGDTPGGVASPGLPPDAVIVGAPAAENQQHVSALFERWPRARIVVVAAAGRDVSLYELRPHKTELGQLSPAEVVQAIREAIGRRAKVRE